MEKHVVRREEDEDEGDKEMEKHVVGMEEDEEEGDKEVEKDGRGRGRRK